MNRINILIYVDPIALMLTVPLCEIVFLGSLAVIGSFFSPGLLLPLARVAQSFTRRLEMPVSAGAAKLLSQLLPELRSDLLFHSLAAGQPGISGPLSRLPQRVRKVLYSSLRFLSKYGLLYIIASPVVAGLTTLTIFAVMRVFLDDPLDIFGLLGVTIPEKWESLAQKYSGSATAIALYGFLVPVVWSIVPFISVRLIRPFLQRLARMSNLS